MWTFLRRWHRPEKMQKEQDGQMVGCFRQARAAKSESRAGARVWEMQLRTHQDNACLGRDFEGDVAENGRLANAVGEADFLELNRRREHVCNGSARLRVFAVTYCVCFVCWRGGPRPLSSTRCSIVAPTGAQREQTRRRISILIRYVFVVGG